MPDWWRNLPMSTGIMPNQSGTLRGCSGLTELYNRGFMIPLWSDLNITHINGEMHWQFADRETPASPHIQGQMGEEFYNIEKFTHFKIGSPWFLKEKEGVLFNLITPFWDKSPFRGYEISSGIIEFKYQHSTNINMFFSKSADNRIDLGTPISHYVPLDNRRVILKHYLISEDEWNKMMDMSSPHSFLMDYRKKKKLMQDREKSKCPFSFRSL